MTELNVGEVEARGGYRGTARVTDDGSQIRYECSVCRTVMYGPNTDLGIRRARVVVTRHFGGTCCTERAAAYQVHRQQTTWPEET